MNERIQSIINEAQQQYKLDDYFLKRYNIFHEKGASNQTTYILSMEWFPNKANNIEDEDDLNPEGTIVMEVNFHSRALCRLVFVGEVPHPRASELFPAPNKKEVIHWVEKVTTLTFEDQFDLVFETESEFHFIAATDHIVITPPGVIQVKFNDEKELTLFSIDGLFPSEEKIEHETFSLKQENLESIFKQQLKLIEFPIEDEQKWVPIYGIDEIYVSNHGEKTLDDAIDQKEVLDLPLEWSSLLEGAFERLEDIDLSTEVTVEQAIENKPHTDSYPITEMEKEAAINETRDLLHKEYPQDSGKWLLHTLSRDHGYLIAEVQPNQQHTQIISHKIKVIIDREKLKAINYIDNEALLEMFADYEKSEELIISMKEAYEKLKSHLKVIPTYVYQPKDDQFYLYGRIDSDYGVIATTGEIVNLNEL